MFIYVAFHGLLVLTYPYLQTSTMISTTAILISKAFAEAHCPFFNDGWLITKTQIVLASHPNGQTPVINNPCTMNMNSSLEGTISSISLEEELAAIFAITYVEFLNVFFIDEFVYFCKLSFFYLVYLE